MFRFSLRPAQLLVVLCLGWAFTAAQGATLAPSAPSIDARAHLLVDFHSGYVMTESNADEHLEPASLTKMMTAYTVFAELKRGHIKLEDKVRISEKAWRMGGSRMFIEVGDEVSVDALLHGLIIQSGNDSSVALAEYVAGDETAFANLMNRYAKDLGMTRTHFTNASGLPDEGHYTTARDMARIAARLIRDHPDYYSWHAIKEYVYNGITQYNRNKLLWRDESVDGVKTGHTKSAGYCLVASAERDGMRLISVVMGAASEEVRAAQSEALLRFGFRFYETHRLYGANEPLTTVRVWKGERPEGSLGLREDLYVTVPRGQYGKLDARMEYDARIVAPLALGEPRGKVRVTLGEHTVAERPLVALAPVGEGSVWRRMSDHVRLMFQ